MADAPSRFPRTAGLPTCPGHEPPSPSSGPPLWNFCHIPQPACTSINPTLYLGAGRKASSLQRLRLYRWVIVVSSPPQDPATERVSRSNSGARGSCSAHSVYSTPSSGSRLSRSNVHTVLERQLRLHKRHFHEVTSRNHKKHMNLVPLWGKFTSSHIKNTYKWWSVPQVIMLSQMMWFSSLIPQAMLVSGSVTQRTQGIPGTVPCYSLPGLNFKLLQVPLLFNKTGIEAKSYRFLFCVNQHILIIYNNWFHCDIFMHVTDIFQLIPSLLGSPTPPTPTGPLSSQNCL